MFCFRLKDTNVFFTVIKYKMIECFVKIEEADIFVTIVFDTG